MREETFKDLCPSYVQKCFCESVCMRSLMAAHCIFHHLAYCDPLCKSDLGKNSATIIIRITLSHLCTAMIQCRHSLQIFFIAVAFTFPNVQSHPYLKVSLFELREKALLSVHASPLTHFWVNMIRLGLIDLLLREQFQNEHLRVTPVLLGELTLWFANWPEDNMGVTSRADVLRPCLLRKDAFIFIPKFKC